MRAAPSTTIFAQIRTMQQIVARHYGITVVDLTHGNREPRYSHPRQVGMYLAHRLGASYSEIGDAFGGKHHTTVMHALQKCRERNIPEGLLLDVLESLTRGGSPT